MPNKSSFFKSPDVEGSRKATERLIVNSDEAAPEAVSPAVDNADSADARRGDRRTGDRRREARSKRVVLLLTPSKYKLVSDAAYDQDLSFNEIVNCALDRMLETGEIASA